MALQISHSDEAWQNVQANLKRWSRESLINALADDAFAAQEQAGHDNGEDAANVLRDLLEDADHDSLVEMAFSTISWHNLCSDDGGAFWIDRDGFHTVSVDLQPEGGE